MEGSQIKTKYLIFLLFFGIAYGADSMTMELIKAYIDDNASKKATLKDVNLTDKNVSIIPDANIPSMDDYKVCQKQHKKAFVYLNGVQAIAVAPHYAISFSRKKPSKYVKYDPFNKIWVIWSKKTLTPVVFKEINEAKNGKYISSITKSKIRFGEFDQVGKYQGTATFNVYKGSLIVCGCCDVYGIGYKKHQFFTPEYIRFLLNPRVTFNGFVGASFKQIRNRVLVDGIDLYFKGLNFCPNDEVVSVDDKKITSKSQLNKIILTSLEGDVLDFYVKRGKSYKHVRAKVGKQPKISLANQSYLEKLGIYLNGKLVITYVVKNSFAQRNGLMRGDKLLQVHFKNVNSITQVRNALVFGGDNSYHLLFSRDDYQFFVQFNKTDLLGEKFVIPQCKAF